jgi:hypothetical protein
MSADPIKLRVSGLDKLDSRDLERELHDDVSFEQEQLTSDQAGEPATVIAVITITALGLRVLAQWLMKQRKRGRIDYTVDVEYPDGRREKRTVTIETSSSEPGSAEVIEKLGAALSLDTELVKQAIASPGS